MEILWGEWIKKHEVSWLIVFNLLKNFMDLYHYKASVESRKNAFCFGFKEFIQENITCLILLLVFRHFKMFSSIKRDCYSRPST